MCVASGYTIWDSVALNFKFWEGRNCSSYAAAYSVSGQSGVHGKLGIGISLTGPWEPPPRKRECHSKVWPQGGSMTSQVEIWESMPERKTPLPASAPCTNFLFLCVTCLLPSPGASKPTAEWPAVLQLRGQQHPRVLFWRDLSHRLPRPYESVSGSHRHYWWGPLVAPKGTLDT